MKLLPTLLLLIFSCPVLMFEGGSFYDGSGAIFPSSYETRFLKQDFKESISLSGCEVERTEEILLGSIKKSFLNHPNLDWPYTKSPKQVFWKHNRQYYGYRTLQNDTIVVVNLLNFKNRKKAKRLFSDWKSEFVIGTGKPYEQNMLTLEINLTKSRIELPAQ